jgi:hypothetical protein
MPIANTQAPYGQYVAGNVLRLLPVLDASGAIVTANGYVGLSFPFSVVDEPMTLAAAGFDPNPPIPGNDVVNVEISPDGINWQPLWIHGTQVQLAADNSLILISVPGLYRLARAGYFQSGTP